MSPELLYGCLVFLSALAVILAVYIARNSATRMPKGGDTPALGPLTKRIDALAESLNGLKSRQKEIEGEWETYYAKMRKLAGRAYRDDQVADGKHKGAKEEEATPAPAGPHDWKIGMARRKHGIG